MLVAADSSQPLLSGNEDFHRASDSRGGKGSHRNFVHPKAIRITLSGKEGDDAHRYQERQVKQAIEEPRKP